MGQCLTTRINAKESNWPPLLSVLWFRRMMCSFPEMSVESGQRENEAMGRKIWHVLKVRPFQKTSSYKWKEPRTCQPVANSYFLQYTSLFQAKFNRFLLTHSFNLQLYKASAIWYHEGSPSRNWEPSARTEKSEWERAEATQRTTNRVLGEQAGAPPSLVWEVQGTFEESSLPFES